MISTHDRLCLGLWALDYIETATGGPWRRFAKFGRAQMEGSAYYVMEGEWKPYISPRMALPDELWYSPIRFTVPEVFIGSATEAGQPIFEQFWQAGWKAYQMGFPVESINSRFDTRLVKQPAIRAKIRASIDPDAALDELKGGKK